MTGVGDRGKKINFFVCIGVRNLEPKRFLDRVLKVILIMYSKLAMALFEVSEA